jgi:methyl-accepting chemotaxis protein
MFGTSKLTIKALIISSLLVLGVAVIALSLLTAKSFQSTAIDSQTQTLSRILEVAAAEALSEIDKISGDMANDTASSSAFRDAFAASSGDDKSSLVSVLDQQFSQRYVTGGLLDVATIKVYDTKFNLVAQSSEGVKGLSNNLPGIIKTKAEPRKGAERLKKIGALWHDGDEPYYSVLGPVGGIFLKGYIEVVVKPQHNFFKIQKLLKTPFMISSVNGKVFKKTDDWTDEPENSLLIHYTVKTASGDPGLNLASIENAEVLFNSINKTSIFTIALYVVLIAVSIGLILMLLNRLFFKPLNKMLESMEQCATGDLTIDTKFSGLVDIQKISASFSTLVEGLLHQVRSVITCSDQVKFSSDSVHDVSITTNQNIQRQQTEISMIATAINEMSSTVQEVARSASNAASSAQSADQFVQNGSATVNKSISSIQRLSQEVSNAADVIGQVKTSTVEIGGVLDVIKTIAEQTNLLALNAAIEAARAGEQGRGFAVVADEVRTLASRTQQSTEEIENMIDALQSNADNAVVVMNSNTELAQETVELANSAGQALVEITHSIETINSMNEQIATAAEEQSQVAEEINRNIVNINDVAQTTAEDSNKTAQSSDELTGLAVQLKELTSRFKV